MGCWDIYCFICGNTCHSSDHDDYPNLNKKEIILLNKELKWLNKCTMLLANNKIIHGCKEVSCNNQFYKNGIKLNYGIELKFGDICVKIYKKFDPLNIDYGIIKKYWNQFISYDDIYNDNNMYIIKDPLLNDNKNTIRIKKIFTQLKLKKIIRPGPSVSATFYKNNDIKIGNNNKFWIISGNKWIQLKDNVIKKKYNINNNLKKNKKINTIPQIGEYNTVPLFVNSFEFKNKMSIIEYIGTVETINYIDKNLL